MVAGEGKRGKDGRKQNPLAPLRSNFPLRVELQEVHLPANPILPLMPTERYLVFPILFCFSV
jgi:hypothetical protein